MIRPVGRSNCCGDRRDTSSKSIVGQLKEGAQVFSVADPHEKDDEREKSSEWWLYVLVKDDHISSIGRKRAEEKKKKTAIEALSPAA